MQKNYESVWVCEMAVHVKLGGKVGGKELSNQNTN